MVPNFLSYFIKRKDSRCTKGVKRKHLITIVFINISIFLNFQYHNLGLQYIYIPMYLSNIISTFTFLLFIILLFLFIAVYIALSFFPLYLCISIYLYYNISVFQYRNIPVSQYPDIPISQHPNISISQYFNISVLRYSFFSIIPSQYYIISYLEYLLLPIFHLSNLQF